MNQDMITRFQEPDNLVRSLAKQEIVQGDRKLAKSLAAVADLHHYKPG